MSAGANPVVEVQFKSTGVEEVRRGLRLVGKEAADAGHASGEVGHSVARGAREAANAIAEMAHSGEMGGRGIRELVKSGAEMAMEFGMGGPLVAALGLLGLAAFSAFKRVRDEMKETREAFEKEVAAMANAGQSPELVKKLKDLEFGQPFNEKGKLMANSTRVPGAFSGSIMDLEAQKRELEQQMASGNFALAYFAKGQLDKLKAVLDPLIEKRNGLISAITNVNSQPASTGMMPFKVTAMSPEMEQKAQDDAFAARQKAMDMLLDIIIKGMPRFHEGASSPEIAALAAAHDAVELNKLLVKYNPGVDHSATRKQADDLRYGVHATIAPIKETVSQLLADARAELVKQIDTDFSQGIRNALVSGLQNAFSGEGLKGLGKGFLKTMLEVFGDLAIKLGAAMIPVGAWLQSFTSALASLNGPAAIAAGLGLVAAGAALKAGAAGIGGAGGGYGGSSGSSYSAPQIIDRGLINPVNGASSLTPRTPVTVNLIGPNDPSAQRQLTELLRNADRRGSI